MNLKKIFLLVAASAALPAMMSAQGFKNPVIPGYYPDPSVCAVGDDFYLVNSTFQYFPGVPIFHSKDLINWEQIGNVLDRPSQVDLSKGGASSGIFAPTIRYHEGKFYMITTNINLLFTGGSGNFIVTADKPEGPWSDPVFIPGALGIDPSLFWDNGKCYIVWSMNGISFSEIDPEKGKLIGETKLIWEGTGGSSPEGPHLYKKDGYYYLLIAEGGTEMGHKVTIARSKNIDGPYTSNSSNPILTQASKAGVNSLLQGTGHADLVQASDGSWWMVFLGFRTSAGKQLHTLGRETNLAPVRWDEGAWPVVNATGTVDVNMNCKTLPEYKFPAKDARIDFTNGKKLGFEWIYTNNPVKSNYVYASNQLQLKATDISIDDPTQTPTFVARRQTDINCTATTKVSLSSSKKGDRGGLTVYMDNKGHYDLAVVNTTDGSQAIELSYRLGQMKHVEKTIPIKNGKSVILKVDGTAEYYSFSYSLDGNKFTEIAVMDSFFLATETLGGFTGVLFGLFSEGKPGTKAVTKVDWFEYIPGPEYIKTSLY